MSNSTFKEKLIFSLSFAVLLLVSGISTAQTNTYIGPSPGNWSNGANWSQGSTPDAADDAVIPAGFTVNMDALTGLTINSLTVNGTLLCSNLLRTYNVTGGGITVGSTGIIEGSATNVIFTSTGNVVNDGTITWTPVGTPGNRIALTMQTTAGLSISGSGAEFSLQALNINSSTTNSYAGTININTTLNGSAELINNGTVVVGTTSNVNTLTNNGAITLTGNNTSATITNAGTINAGGATPFSGPSTLTAGSPGNTVNYTNAAGQSIKVPAGNVYHNLGLSGGGNKTAAAGLIINGNVTISGTAVFAAGTNTITVGGDWTNNSAAATPFTFTAPHTVSFSSAGPAQTIGGTATTSFDNIVFSPTALTVYTINPATNALNLSANLSVNDNTVLSPTPGVVISNAGANAGTLAGPGAGLGTLRVTSTGSPAPGDYSNQYRFATSTLTNIRVEYSGAGNQLVNANGANGLSASYGFLATSGSGTKTLQGNVTAGNGINVGAGSTLTNGANNLAVSSGGIMIDAGGVLDCGAGNVNITAGGMLNNGVFQSGGAGIVTLTAGNLVNNGTFAPLSGTVSFTAAVVQNITGSNNLSFNNLSTNAGGLQLNASNNITVNGALTFNGVLTTNANRVSISSTGSTAGAGAGRFVAGNLEKYINVADPSAVFELGDGTDYLPVNFTFTNVTTGGYLQVRVNLPASDHANIATADIIAAESVNRTWTLVNSGGTLALSNFKVQFSFLPADVDAGASTGIFVAGIYNAGWIYPSAMGVRTATTTEVDLLTIADMGDFQIGEPAPPVFVTQPVNTPVCEGNTVNFTSSATGYKLSAQWQISTNGGGTWTNIGGASSPGHSFVANAGQNGNQYRVVYSNIVGSITSAGAVLTVNTAPLVTVPPSAIAQCEGTSANFTVTATGTALTYQWRKDGVNLSDGGAITGSSTASLVINPISASDAGSYEVIVGGTCPPSVTSAPATLTVNTSPAITTPPAAVTQCEGTAASFTVAATGTALTYQWRKDGVNLSDGGAISGATTSSLVISPIAASDAGNYDVVISGACAPPVTSAPAALSVNMLPAITTPPSDVTQCAGTSASFAVAASGTAITYQWRKDGVNLTDGGSVSGSASSNLVINPISPADAGSYDVVVSGTCAPPAVSAAALLTIDEAPVIIADPASVAQCEGTSANFLVSATGAGLTYQWRKDGVNLANSGAVSGVTTASLTINPISAADIGSYDVVITGTCAPPATSAPASLSINNPPGITSGPSSLVQCAGTSATFTVTATGAGLAYQWRKGGVNLVNGGAISGATTASLTINPVGAGDAGSYDVIVTGLCAPPAVSAQATLTVNTAPVITSHPSSIAQCEGSQVTFTVSATGTSLTYQWRKDGINLTDGGPVTGSQISTLTINPIFASDAGSYDVVISGVCNPPVTSSPAILVINTPPAVTTPPANQAVCDGGTATFTVTATGAGLTYQWRKDGVNLSNGGNISGALTASLTINPAGSADAGNYDVIITGTCSPAATSAVATLTIETAPAIVTQPADLTVCEGSPAVFSVTASGAGLMYQWRRNGVNLSNGGSVSGATTSTLTINPASASDAATYDVIVTGNCVPAVTSSGATLIIDQLPAITSSPAAVTQCEGTSATFTVTATGTAPSYQWRRNGVNLSNGGAISGATTATLTINPIAVANAGNYDVVVTGACAPGATSSVAVLTVNTSPAITAQPMNDSKCTGGTASFSVTATGAGLTYQWRRNGVNLSDGGNVSGSATATLTITGVSATDAAAYDVVISGTCAPPVTSNTATLVIDALPVINTHPSSISACEGSVATFNVAAAGGGVTYQWRKAGVNMSDGGSVSGSATATLTITGVALSDAGSYDVVISSVCASSVASSPAALTVNTAPAITAQPSDASLCEGSTATFTVAANGAGLTYQWRKGGVNLTDGGSVSGSATPTLTISPVAVTDADNYDVIISGSCTPGAASSQAVLTVNLLPVITSSPADATQCEGTSLTLNVAATGSGLSYQWRKDGINISDGGSVTGATTAALTINPLAIGDAGNYDVLVSGICNPPAASAAAAVTVDAIPAVTVPPSNVAVCPGSTATFTVTATGTALSYQWRKNGINLSDGGNISGATTATLTITSVNALDIATYDVLVGGTCNPPATSPAAALSISVIPLITSGPSNSNVCEGATTSFSISASGVGLTYQWRKNGVSLTDGGNISGSSGAVLTISGVTASDAASYDVNVMSSCGTSIVSSPANLVVNPSTVGGAVSGGTVVCPGTNGGTLNLSGHTGSVIRWEASENNGNSWMPVINNSTAQSFANLIRTTWYRAVVQSGNCGILASAHAVVSVSTDVFPGSIIGNEGVCEGKNQGTVSVANLTGGSILKWESSTDEGATWTTINDTSQSIGYKDLSVATLYRAWVSAGPCDPIPSPTVRIKINAKPVADFSIISGSRSGEPILFRNTTTVSNDNINESIWRFGDGALSVSMDAEHRYSRSGRFRVSLTAISEKGCVDSTVKEILIAPGEDFLITNVLTLNDNGSNDRWFVEGIEKFDFSEVRIFNRYGSEIFFASPYLNNWDGTYKGEKLPDGTYYYVLKVNSGEEKVYKGTITIFR
jgi:gliding motility-associated-like protein